MKDNSEQILNTISDLKKILLDRRNLYDHFYSGDKDTMIEAYNIVVNGKYNLGDFYSHESDQRNEYDVKYRIEISKCYHELVSFSKEITNKISSIEDMLEEFRKFELDYMGLDEKREYLIKQILES